MYVTCMQIPERSEEVIRSPKVAFTGIECCLTWMLGTKLECSTRVARQFQPLSHITSTH